MRLRRAGEVHVSRLLVVDDMNTKFREFVEALEPKFQKKRRVADMEIRYVEEADPVKQALLEIYAATSFGTPYNDFENH